MSTTFYRDDLDRPVTPAVSPVAVRPASGVWTPAPQVPVPAHGPYCRPFGNAMRNSRLPYPSGAGFRKILWKTDLDTSSRPRFVLHSGERILVQKDYAWELFDQKGLSVMRGGSGAGDILLDAADGLFYVNDQDGLVVARKLLDGREAYAFFPMFGSGYVRTVLARENRTVWVIGVEIPQMSHKAGRPAEYTVMEVQDLGDSLRKDEDGILVSNQRVATLITRPVPLLTAMKGGTLVLGAPDHVYTVDERLNVTGDHQFSGTTETMSLDEEGRIYLVVRMVDKNEQKTRSLMVLSPEGSELMRVRLPEPPGDAVAPPVVGYDHRTYLLEGDTVVAIDPNGLIRWKRFAGGPVAGAVAAGDGRVLVAAGSIIAAYDANGEREVLFALDGERWATPPVITGGGRLLAASEKTLYCFEPLR